MREHFAVKEKSGAFLQQKHRKKQSGELFLGGICKMREHLKGFPLGGSCHEVTDEGQN